MKVLYIDPQSSYNLAQYDYLLLSNLNAEIVYCCSILYDAPISNKISYRHVFRYNAIRNNIVKGISYLISLIKVVKIAKKEKPEVIHIQWWKSWFLDYLVLKYLKKYTKTIVFTAHNVMPHDTGNAQKERCVKYYKRVDKIIVHTQRSKDELVEDFKINANKVYVIPHGLLPSMIDKTTIRKQYEMLEDAHGVGSKLIISSIGYQGLYKGTDIIKQAYLGSKVLQENSNILFIIAGRGDIFKKDLMGQFDNLLVFDDFISSDRLEAIMDVTDILLLPYRKISQSGVLLTAISKEIPYVATDIGGLIDPIKIAPVGWVLKNNSVVELRSMLEYLVSHPEEIALKKKNKENWDLVKRHYDWGIIGIETMKCYYQ